ncbi:hypothetical protein HYS28_00755, partial [Candidatus Uhrbacteria bacterium]|nr:hypothetical protein [Candidatus Uhrbacteria bacterium]
MEGERMGDPKQELAMYIRREFGPMMEQFAQPMDEAKREEVKDSIYLQIRDMADRMTPDELRAAVTEQAKKAIEANPWVLDAINDAVDGAFETAAHYA